MSNLKLRDDLGFYGIFAMLAALFVAYLGYDLWEVCAGHVDLNRHLPFFIPMVLGIFAAITWAIKKYEPHIQESEVHKRR